MDRAGNSAEASPQLLGYEQMDANHVEMVELIQRAHECRDMPSLIALLDQLYRHTERHFAEEERWMQESGFKLYSEHREEHRHLLHELDMQRKRLRPANVPFVRAFLLERIPDWLDQHLQRMDSLLAAHLKTQAQG